LGKVLEDGLEEAHWGTEDDDGRGEGAGGGWGVGGVGVAGIAGGGAVLAVEERRRIFESQLAVSDEEGKAMMDGLARVDVG
jgi:hypothetical protein